MGGMSIDIALYGAFRQYLPDARLTLPIDLPAGVAELRRAARAALEARSPDAALLSDTAVFATDSEVLAEDATAPAGARLGLLPPVSGG